MGLIIHEAETMQSADYMTYGKVSVFRGVIYPHVTKRWARVTSINNNQIPGLASIGASAVTNGMMVAHISTSPINSMGHYHWSSQFVYLLVKKYNPAIRSSIPLPVDQQIFNILGYSMDT